MSQSSSGRRTKRKKNRRADVRTREGRLHPRRSHRRPHLLLLLHRLLLLIPRERNLLGSRPRQLLRLLLLRLLVGVFARPTTCQAICTLLPLLLLLLLLPPLLLTLLLLMLLMLLLLLLLSPHRRNLISLLLLLLLLLQRWLLLVWGLRPLCELTTNVSGRSSTAIPHFSATHARQNPFWHRSAEMRRSERRGREIASPNRHASQAVPLRRASPRRLRG